MAHANARLRLDRAPRAAALALAALLGSWSAAPAEAPSTGWCAGVLATPTGEAGPWTQVGERGHASRVVPLEWVRADYDVEILGNALVGSLVLELRNPADVEVQASYFGHRPSGVSVASMELLVEDGSPARVELTDVSTSRSTPKSAPRAGRAAGRGRPQPDAAPSVASRPVLVGPHESIRLRARFERTLPYRDGAFHVVLPAVGGECVPLPGAARWPAAGGPGGPLGVRLVVRHDRPLDVADSATHPVDAVFDGSRTIVELTRDDPRGDRAFEFAYALGEGAEPALAGYVAPEREGEREVLLMLAPPVRAPREAVRPKEALFVLDTSGSMAGAKLEQARGALGACLERLGDGDRFNLVEFSQAFTMLAPEPVAFDVAALGSAVAWLDSQVARGGTRLLPALSAAFAQPTDADLHRLVVVLTDGMVQDEMQVRELLRQELGTGRLFLVGIGANARHDVIQRLAEFGRGTAVAAADPAGLRAALEELFDSVAEPLAWDLELEWGDAEVLDLTPSRLPDLYAGRPVTVRARVRGELPDSLELTAQTMDGPRTFRVATPAGGAPEYDLGKGHARD